LGFAGNWVFGDWFGWHGKKTSALIEAKATRKNYRHPQEYALTQLLILKLSFGVPKWLQAIPDGSNGPSERSGNPEVYLTFNPIFERIWLEAKKRLH
jgi:hypothetical protein